MIQSKRRWISVLSILLTFPQALAWFDNVRAGSTGIAIYDNHKLLIDFLLFFTLFMALSWVSIRTFYGKEEQKGAAIGIAVSISLALAIGAIAAGLSASFSSSFIKYVLFFLGIVLLYLLITKLAKVESNWGKLAALLIAAIIVWLLFNVGNIFSWEGSLRPSGGGFFDDVKYTLGRMIDVPTRGGSTDLMPFAKWIVCILAGILAYYLIVTIGEVEKGWYKLLAVLAAILIAWLLCLAIDALTKKKTDQGKSLWNEFTDWVAKIWPFGKGTADRTPEAPPPEPEGACIPQWEYSEWSACTAEGTQTRTATDNNGCRDGYVTEQSCEPPPPKAISPPKTPATIPPPTTSEKKSSKPWFWGGLGVGILTILGAYFFLRKRGGIGKKLPFKESIDLFKTHTQGKWAVFLQNLKDYINLLTRIRKKL